ncbi:MAG: 4Fe-4S dicluster domain-containing protein [Candidatus Helarchaeota archaeon]
MSDQCTQCDQCTKNCPTIIVTKQEKLWNIFFHKDIDLWSCSSCFRCEESCPVDLSVRDAIFEKRRALDHSAFPRKFMNYFKNILNSGHVFFVDELTNEMRNELELEPISFEEIKADLKKLWRAVAH